MKDENNKTTATINKNLDFSILRVRDSSDAKNPVFHDLPNLSFFLVNVTKMHNKKDDNGFLTIDVTAHGKIKEKSEKENQIFHFLKEKEMENKNIEIQIISSSLEVMEGNFKLRSLTATQRNEMDIDFSIGLKSNGKISLQKTSEGINSSEDFIPDFVLLKLKDIPDTHWNGISINGDKISIMSRGGNQSLSFLQRKLWENEPVEPKIIAKPFGTVEGKFDVVKLHIEQQSKDLIQARFTLQEKNSS